MFFTPAQWRDLILRGLIQAGHYITPKRVIVTCRGGKFIVVFNGIQHSLCANQLKADHNVRASRDHIRKYKRELVAFFKEIGLKSYVYVRGKNIDNVYTRLTFAPNGISGEILMRILNDAFYSPWGDVTFKVGGA
jgi:hypothetical protein